MLQEAAIISKNLGKTMVCPLHSHPRSTPSPSTPSPSTPSPSTPSPSTLTLPPLSPSLHSHPPSTPSPSLTDSLLLSYFYSLTHFILTDSHTHSPQTFSREENFSSESKEVCQAALYVSHIHCTLYVYCIGEYAGVHTHTCTLYIVCVLYMYTCIC